jgi:hypothetical protein
MPAALRLLVSVAAVLALVAMGLFALSEPVRDDWARLPSRLKCQLQEGPKPPTDITVSSVAATHPRDSVLLLVVRYAGPLPPSPTGSPSTGFVGYQLNYSIANNGQKFVDLSPQEGTDDLAIRSLAAGNLAEVSMRADRDTRARRIAADTLEIYLDLKRLGVADQPVNPELTVASQFNTPSIVTVRYATQVCRG